MAAGCAATAVLGLRGDPGAGLTVSATAAVAVPACACVFLAVSDRRSRN